MAQLSQHRWFSLRLGVGHAHKPDAPWQKTTWILHNSQTRPGSFFPMCTEHQHTVFSTHTLIMVLTQRHLHPLLYSGAPILCIYSKHWIHSQNTTLLLWNWGGKSELKQLPFFFFFSQRDAVVLPGRKACLFHPWAELPLHFFGIHRNNSFLSPLPDWELWVWKKYWAIWKHLLIK